MLKLNRNYRDYFSWLYWIIDNYLTNGFLLIDDNDEFFQEDIIFMKEFIFFLSALEKFTFKVKLNNAASTDIFVDFFYDETFVKQEPNRISFKQKEENS